MPATTALPTVSVTSGHRTTEHDAATPSMRQATLERFGGWAPGEASCILRAVSSMVASRAEAIARGSPGSFQPSTASPQSSRPGRSFAVRRQSVGAMTARPAMAGSGRGRRRTPAGGSSANAIVASSSSCLPHRACDASSAPARHATRRAGCPHPTRAPPPSPPRRLACGRAQRQHGPLVRGAADAHLLAALVDGPGERAPHRLARAAQQPLDVVALAGHDARAVALEGPPEDGGEDPEAAANAPLSPPEGASRPAAARSRSRAQPRAPPRRAGVSRPPPATQRDQGQRRERREHAERRPRPTALAGRPAAAPALRSGLRAAGAPVAARAPPASAPVPVPPSPPPRRRPRRPPRRPRRLPRPPPRRSPRTRRPRSTRRRPRGALRRWARGSPVSCAPRSGAAPWNPSVTFAMAMPWSIASLPGASVPSPGVTAVL